MRVFGLPMLTIHSFLPPTSSHMCHFYSSCLVSMDTRYMFYRYCELLNHSLSPPTNQTIVTRSLPYFRHVLTLVVSHTRTYYVKRTRIIMNSWETQYDPVPVRDWMKDHPIVPITACILYGVFIVLGQQYFAKRDRLRWKYILASWNFALAIFSAIGFTRTAPWLFHMVKTYTSDEILCFDPESSYGSGSTGLWVQLFVLSKFPYVNAYCFICFWKSV